MAARAGGALPAARASSGISARPDLAGDSNKRKANRTSTRRPGRTGIVEVPSLALRAYVHTTSLLEEPFPGTGRLPSAGRGRQPFHHSDRLIITGALAGGEDNCLVYCRTV